jgi:16S rRNA (guanine527-N7)-methyltransferase
VPEDRVAAAIVRRASLAGVLVPPPMAASLSAYVQLLARWNRTINLTALEVSPPSDNAIDRLIVEPLAAAELLRSTDRSAIDIGSGGGSPAIPLKLARPDLRFVLIEMKARKSAFLREAIRHLSLENAAVETTRVEDLAGRGAMTGQFDVATLRAVRGDRGVLSAIRALLAPGGRMLWFGGVRENLPPDSGFQALPSPHPGRDLPLELRRRDDEPNPEAQ